MERGWKGDGKVIVRNRAEAEGNKEKKFLFLFFSFLFPLSLLVSFFPPSFFLHLSPRFSLSFFGFLGNFGYIMTSQQAGLSSPSVFFLFLQAIQQVPFLLEIVYPGNFIHGIIWQQIRGAVCKRMCRKASRTQNFSLKNMRMVFFQNIFGDRVQELTFLICVFTLFAHLWLLVYIIFQVDGNTKSVTLGAGAVDQYLERSGLSKVPVTYLSQGIFATFLSLKLETKNGTVWEASMAFVKERRQKCQAAGCDCEECDFRGGQCVCGHDFSVHEKRQNNR